MKSLIPVVFLLAGSAAFAQYGGGYGGIRPQPYGSVTGFGSVLYPGLGHPPLPGSGTGTVLFPSGVRGGLFNGRPMKPGSRYGGYGYNSRGAVAYPVFVGPYYGYDGDMQQQQQQSQQPQTILIQQPTAPAPAAPNVTINQYFRSDGTPESGADAGQSGQAALSRTPAAVAPTRRSAADDEATIYLIAYKDQTIMPALAYWLEGDTLNYITREGTHNRASMALIDRDFSRRLNNERQVEFSLP